MNTVKYTKEQLFEAIKNSTSWHDVLKLLGKNPKSGGCHQIVKLKAKEWNLDTSHFLGQAHGKNTGKVKTYAKDYFSKEKVHTQTLKNKLLLEGIKEHKCECCNNTHWLGDLIPIELHHIDGNKKNNQLNNLQILCPNCHAKTPNYRALNKGK